MKKTPRLVLAVILIFALLISGCGAASTPGKTEDSTANETAATQTSAVDSAEGSVNPADRFENKELNIAVFEGGYGSGYWYDVVAAFEAAYPGVKVNMQISPTIHETIRPQMIAGNVPDFLALNGTSYSIIVSLILERGLLDITDVFEGNALGSDEPLKDQILDGTVTSGYCCPYGDGKIYQCPLSASPCGLIYNVTLFEENGWELPTTWDEFFELGEKAKEKGIALFTYQGIYPYYLQWGLFPSIVSAMGLDGFSDFTSYKEGSVINTKALDVLKKFEKMADEGYILPGTTALNHTQSQQAHLQNQALFIPCGNWIENEMADSPRADGYVFGMAPSPALEEGDMRYVPVALETMSIPAAAKNPELAKEFLRFLYTDESVKLYAEKSSSVIATKAALELAKPYISEASYNFFSIFNLENVSSYVLSFDAQAQGSKVNIDDLLYGPAAEVVNGTMTAEEWAQSLEDGFAQIRSEIAAE